MQNSKLLLGSFGCVWTPTTSDVQRQVSAAQSRSRCLIVERTSQKGGPTSPNSTLDSQKLPKLILRDP